MAQFVLSFLVRVLLLFDLSVHLIYEVLVPK